MSHKKPQGRRSFGRLRQLPSKRWQAAYVGPDGILCKAPRTFDDKDTATSWLARERRLIDLDEWTPPSQRATDARQQRLTLSDYSTTWLVGRQLKPRTVEHYRQLLDQHILPVLGPLPLKTITPELVDSWFASLDKGKPTVRAHAYALLKTIMGDAVDRDLVVKNPCRIRGASSVKRAHTVEPLSVAELEALVLAMPEKHRLAVLLAAWCALRFGELTELRRKDVDLKGAVLKVRRGVVRVDGEVHVGTPKSLAGVRDVTIPPHLLPVVEDHLSRFAAPGRDGLLFPAVSGGHLSPTSLYGKAPKVVDGELRGGWGFYRARVVIGRPGLHFHDLRHSGAVLAALTGATLAELMERLGHSTPSMAIRYQHIAQGRGAELAEGLSRMAEGSS